MPIATKSKPVVTDLPSVEVEEPARRKIPTKSKDKTPATKARPVATFETANGKVDRAERLARRLANGEELDADELEFLSGELGWGRAEQERQVRRAGSILKLQAQAGKQSDLAERKIELKETFEKAVVELEAVTVQVEHLMAQRDKIQWEVRDIETDVETRERAMAGLREKCPAHVLRLHSQLVGQLKGGELNRQRVGLQSRVTALEGMKALAKWSDKHSSQISSIVHGIPADERPRGILDDRGRVHRSLWEQYVAGKLSELPAMVLELENLEIKYEKKMKDIDLHLDFYLS